MRRILMALAIPGLSAAGLALAITPAHAAAIDVKSYCPASTIKADNLAALSLPSISGTALVEGVTVDFSDTYNGGSAGLTQTSKYSPVTDTFWASNRWFDAYISGTRQNYGYDLAGNVLYNKITQGYANSSVRQAAKRLGHQTVWTMQPNTDSTATVLNRELAYAFGDLADLTGNVSSGAATATCTLDTTAHTVQYVMGFTTGTRGNATMTLTFREDGAPTSFEESYGTMDGSSTFAAQATITYGQPTGQSPAPAPAEFVTSPSAFQSALAAAALVRMKTDALADANYYVQGAANRGGKVSAIRASLQYIRRFAATDYFWGTSWVPTMHISNVAGGATVWCLDPQTQKKLSFTIVHQGAAGATATDNLP